MSSFLFMENDNFQKQRYVLFKLIYEHPEFSDVIKSSFPSYHLYKGNGRIVVSSNEAISKAKELLLNHMEVSESYFHDIYPENFITHFDSDYKNENFSLIELGKFEIKNLDVFLSLLFENGILINYSFS